MSQLATSFGDSTYSAANKPSVATLKADIQTIEVANNDTDSTAAKLTESQTLTNKILTSPVINTQITGTAILDEDTMTSDSAVKVPTQQSVKAYVDAAIVAVKSALFPIGSIYTAIVSTNPNTLLGFGTWTAFGAGKVIVGLDGADADFDTAEETGGAKTVSVAHTHAAGTLATGYDSPQTTAESGTNTTIADNNHTHAISGSTGAMSANGTPSIVQPYIVAYMWKRTA